MTNHPRRWWNCWLTHRWGKWQDAGILRRMGTEFVIGTLQQRECEVCGKKQMHKEF